MASPDRRSTPSDVAFVLCRSILVILALTNASLCVDRGSEPNEVGPFAKGSRMTIESNKRTMHRFTEFINTASEKLAGELISPNAIFYVPGRQEPMRGPAGYLATIAMMRSGFPDIQWTLEETIAEDDRVAARLRCAAPIKARSSA